MGQNRKRAAHYDHVRAIERRYEKSDRGKAKAANRRARLIEGELPERGLSTADWKDVRERQAGRCFWCDMLRPLTADHLIPLARGGLHKADNIVGACAKCNSARRDRLPEEWMAWQPIQPERENAHEVVSVR